MTLPWTMTGTEQFSAIHSNPPGIPTDSPAIVRRHIGKGSVLWTAAPLEMSRPYMSRQAVRRLVESLLESRQFSSNAPKFVEIMCWEKSGKRYFAAINEQEESPVAPMGDIEIRVPGRWKASLLPERKPLAVTENGGETVIYLPKLYLAQMIEAEIVSD